MFFIAYAFKGQVLLFAGQVKIVSHSSCRTSAILKYFCPLVNGSNSVNTDQTASLGAVRSGSKVFVCMLKLVINISINMQQTTFSDASFS